MNFLKGIQTRKGEHPKDVAVCIQAIEDELIQAYAEMIDNIDLNKCKDCRCSPISSKSQNEISFKELRMPTPKDLHDNQKSGNLFTNIRRASGDLVTKKVPFSINYSEMHKKIPIHLEQLFLAKEESKLADRRINIELLNLKQAVSDIHTESGVGMYFFCNY